MFTKIRLSNFKSFTNSDGDQFDLRRLSVFIGPNGSGKSSALQSLLIWKKSIGQSTFNLGDDAPDLGGRQDVTTHGNSDAKLGFTVVDQLSLSYFTQGPPVNVEVDVNCSMGDPPVLEYSAAIGALKFTS